MTSRKHLEGISGEEEYLALKAIEQEQVSVTYSKAEDGLRKKQVEDSDWN